MLSLKLSAGVVTKEIVERSTTKFSLQSMFYMSVCLKNSAIAYGGQLADAAKNTEAVFGGRHSLKHLCRYVPSVNHNFLRIFMDCLLKGRTITEYYYSKSLDRFSNKLKNTRPHLAKKQLLFHHDNAPAQSLGVVAVKLLPYPPFLPE